MAQFVSAATELVCSACTAELFGNDAVWQVVSAVIELGCSTCIAERFGDDEMRHSFVSAALSLCAQFTLPSC